MSTTSSPPASPSASPPDAAAGASTLVPLPPRVYVSNLVDGTTNRDILALFEQYGALVNLTLTRHSALGLVASLQYQDADAVDAAMRADGVRLRGRHIKVVRETLRVAVEPAVALTWSSKTLKTNTVGAEPTTPPAQAAASPARPGDSESGPPPTAAQTAHDQTLAEWIQSAAQPVGVATTGADAVNVLSGAGSVSENVLGFLNEIEAAHVTQASDYLIKMTLSTRGEARRGIWSDWARQLGEPKPRVARAWDRNNGFPGLTAPPRLSFKDVFLCSKSVIAVTASFLLEPTSADSELLELYSRCLLGDQDLHRRIVERLRKLAAEFSACPPPITTVATILTVVNIVKQAPQFDNSVQALLDSEVKLDAQLQTVAAEFARLRKDIPADGTPEGIAQRNERVKLRNQVTVEYLRLLSHKHECVLKRRSPELSHAEVANMFAQLETIFEPQVSGAKEACTAAQDRQRELEKERETLLDDHKRRHLDHEEEKQAALKKVDGLFERRRELEAQLAAINAQLREAEAEVQAITTRPVETQDVNAKIRQVDNDIHDLRATLNSDERRLEMLSTVEAFVTEFREPMTAEIKKQTSGQSGRRVEVVTAYVDAFSLHLSDGVERFAILSKQVTFLACKVMSARQERQTVAELGDPDLLEEQDRETNKLCRLLSQTRQELSAVINNMKAIRVRFTQFCLPFAVEESPRNIPELRKLLDECDKIIVLYETSKGTPLLGI